MNTLKNRSSRNIWFAYIIVIVAGLYIAAMPGCGVRKTQSNVTKIEEAVQGKGELKEATEETETRSTVENSKDSTAKKIESTSTYTREKFNPDGSLAERITGTKNKKSTDNSTKTKNKVDTYRRNLTVVTNVVITTRITKEQTNKDKTVDRSNTLAENLGGGWVIFGAIVVVAAFFFLVKWLVKKA